MVNRIYVEKKQGFDLEAEGLKRELCDILKIKGIERIRTLNRYDAEMDEKQFEICVDCVFSEPPTDNAFSHLEIGNGKVIAVEYLPGQFDQRADSAAQCVQLVCKGEKPLVRSAKIFIIYGDVSDKDFNRIKAHLINPVESREASLDLPSTLKMSSTVPEDVRVIDGFTTFSDRQLEAFSAQNGLAMDIDDIRFCQCYFKKEGRQPTITEIKILDTYWSDHCRHTTFSTTIDKVTFEDDELKCAYDRYIAVRKELNRTKPINLMDIATIAAKYLKKQGKLAKLDESEEINACTVKIKVEVNGKEEDWLLLFKNETHNHPTEIEPFGGAATCIGGAIRDPLSGRAYAYAAMRVTGAADPLTAVEDTMKGKLPQRKIVTTAAQGYSSYGNQIGLATGLVDEIYHPGYAAKRMEIGAVIAATPNKNVVRLVPKPGDVVLLLGGKTGRDGCGGATGSSKQHTVESLETCGAEVQKGNAPEERKLQRLFRNYEASSLIKRCNDFGAGGVSVAIGELADGLDIDLDMVPKKYDGLDGTELAISESQERMAVVVSAENEKKFSELAAAENIECTAVAKVKADPRLTIRWRGKIVADISREFLNSNGAEKHIELISSAGGNYQKSPVRDFEQGMKTLLADLNVCGKRGLCERFDSTIGAGTVLMPFGGKYQLTPNQAMVNKISVEKGETDDCSFMAYGFNPYISEISPYKGAYLAVIESISKLIASGASPNDVYLTLQEYFEKPQKDSRRFGKPFAALLGALSAQLDLGIAAIGGKDSMSGTFEKLDVPPTLVSFAVTTGKTTNVISPEFKKDNSNVVLIKTELDERGLPCIESLKSNFAIVHGLISSGKATACATLTYGGIAEWIFKMCIGNKVGFKFADGIKTEDLFKYGYGSFIVETEENVGICLGKTMAKKDIVLDKTNLSIKELLKIYDEKLESIFPTRTAVSGKVENCDYLGKKTVFPTVKTARPTVLIPVFPGTNCEYDTAKAFENAGARVETFVLRNLTPEQITHSVQTFANKMAESQIVFIPGGFSGGDEPDGSGKFITAFFRNEEVSEQVEKLLGRGGLMGGICNGFQALIKLGLVPFGKIVPPNSELQPLPTLTFNDIFRHQSRIVSTRVCSTASPWLSGVKVGSSYNVAISHGEGKFVCSPDLFAKLKENGQIMTQYADFDGNASMDIQFNPNGSYMAVEGLLSPDGRIFGKMGHCERIGRGLYKNIIGDFDLKLFESGVKYFK